MLYVFKNGASNGARELAEAITATNCRRLKDLSSAHFGSGIRSGDLVVCWGEAAASLPTGVRVLNGAPIRNKLTDAQVLQAAGVPTIITFVGRTPPPAPPVAASDPAVALINDLMDALEDYRIPVATTDVLRSTALRNPVHQRALEELESRIRGFRTAVAAPVPRAVAAPATGWVGRMNNHVGGNDLLRPPTTPDFWVKREEFASEIRLHSFLGRSIRAGQKSPRTSAMGFTGTPHAWIRSYDGGWFINYDGFESSRAQKDLAHSAIAALNLDFGAVDIGIKADGTMMVLEVNRAPGLEGGTVDAYAAAVSRWVSEEWTSENRPTVASRRTRRAA